MAGSLRSRGRLVLWAAASAYLAYAIAKALAASVWNDDFPESLAIKVEALPRLFPLHMVTGGLALGLIPLALLLRRHPRWHRPLGWLVAADVAVAGLTAFPVAWLAPVTLGSALGFTAQALVWLVLLGQGLRAIRRGRVAQHRRAMLLMAATAAGALVFRINLALWAMLGPRHLFDTAYACDAWIAWLLPLTATALWLRARPDFGTHRNTHPGSS